MIARARTASAIRFRPELHDRLVAEADARETSINWLVNQACEFFLDRLIPADEIVYTRDAAGGAS